LEFIRHTDWLGSSRLGTTWAHAVYSKESYAPFGETYNEAGTPDRSFTGQDQDTVAGAGATGVYDFLFRKYDPAAGRWISPDPLGWGAVNAADPQSLNRYAYVENQPMNAIDPMGLAICVSAGDGQIINTGDNNGCDDGWYIYMTTPGAPAPPAPPPPSPLTGPTCADFGDCQQPSPGTPTGPGSGGGGGGGGNPWYQNSCVTNALKTGAIDAGVDAIGFIPEAGGIARMIGHGGGYRGVVADQLGHSVVKAVGKTAGTVNSAAGANSSDWTSWVSAGITVGDLIPVVNEFTTVAALTWDTGVTAYKVYQCHK
jgi:RHS repeat-associated protein